jgi:hypothetical protein
MSCSAVRIRLGVAISESWLEAAGATKVLELALANAHHE